MATTGTTTGAWFGVEFFGGIVGAFRTLSFEITTASGLTAPKGAAPLAFHKSALTLTRQASDKGDAFKMFGQQLRVNGSIVMYDATSTEVQRWNVVNGTVSRYTQYADATGSQVEEISITYDGLELLVGGTAVAAL